MIPIPERMKKFPLWRGVFPIHYTVFVKDGVPDFKVMHEVRRIDALNRNLCHLCGEKMKDTLFAFIGGPNCLKHHAFVDGPMHPECAEYAAAACPFLRDAGATYSKKTGGDARPEKMYLCLSKSYDTRRNPFTKRRGSPGVQADQPFSEGQLVVIAGEWESVTEIPTGG